MIAGASARPGVRCAMTTRTLQVDVTDLAETMDFAVVDGMTSYLDLRSGGIVHADATTVVDDHLLAIPPFDKPYRYQRMLRFCGTLDPEQRTVFAVAVTGDGAFRRFKNLINHHGLVDAWTAFQLGLDRAEAVAWLTEHGVAVIDVSKRVPAAPSAAPTTSVGLVDLLLLGAPDGKTELVDGRVLRRIAARSPEDSRELFWGLARALSAETGVTLPGTNSNAAELDSIDAGRFHLRRRDDAVELAIDVPLALWDRFTR